MYLAAALVHTAPLAANRGGAVTWGIIWGVILLILIACVAIPVYFSKKRRRESV
jgi:ABC-type multidrug transport system permease subunit